MEKEQIIKQPWLHSALTDGIFILSPPFVALLLVVLFPNQFQASANIPIVYWLILIVFIDVAHVYSTLYRTYFNPDTWRKSQLFIIIPILCYLTGVILHSIDALFFWRVLAYLAVYHFIRQQYGFMRLYSRKENTTKLFSIIDKVTIYSATIYPIIYWHMDGNRQFNWFIENDFLLIPAITGLITASKILYLLVIFIYLIKEAIFIYQSKKINIPRNLLIVGTFLSWYFGIIYFNGDLAFTTLNVISHGIPYMALIWIAEKKKGQHIGSSNFFLRLAFGKYGLLYFLLILVIFAFLEEGLWDGLVWKEHGEIFNLFAKFPKIADHHLLSLLVPLLALPQSTHYVLDGFIWRSSQDIGSNSYHRDAQSVSQRAQRH